MSSGRPLSGETIVLLGLGAAFAAVGVFICVAAYSSGQAKLDRPSPAVATLSPWLPPALPPTAQVQDEEPIAPVPEATSVFAEPPPVGPPPVARPRLVRPSAAPQPDAPGLALGAPMPPPRPIELNPPRIASAPLAVSPANPLAHPSLSDIGAKPASLSQYDQFTAVYDLSAHTVYLPGGERLEAHSGLGPLRDDPAHVDEADRGATPPHVYDLTLRESLFHGVQALRLNPLGGPESIFGRAGLLAHTYMLGPGGDSNGCVSFKDYDAFLQAFQNGRIKRLAVVGSVK